MVAKNSIEILGEIKKYMFIHDISQDELALRMNKSKQSVSMIFKTANPTLDTLFCMLSALNVEMDYSFKEIPIINMNNKKDITNVNCSNT